MKKIFLALICAVLFFTSCVEKFYSVMIENNSAKEVEYTYDGSVDTLEPGDSKTYDVKAYTRPPEDIKVSEGAMSVRMENTRGEKFTFVDNLFSLDLKVANTLGVKITIEEADNYLETDDGSIELEIPASVNGDPGKATANIYTIKPSFTSDFPYPVAFDWILVKATEDTVENTDTIYLTIK